MIHKIGLKAVIFALIAGTAILEREVAAERIRAGPGQFFFDSDDRVTILHGLNLLTDHKLPPFDQLRGRLDDLDPLPLWGVSVARVLFIWEVFETQRGQYNTTYLDYIGSIVEYLNKLGIVSIVDFHQDGYSRWMNGGCGDGFPEWATPAALIQLNPLNRVPNYPGKCHVPQDTSQGVDPFANTAWVAFYANWNGVRDSFLNAWDKIAEYFSGRPGLLGYDMLNEPFGGAGILSRLYEDTAKRIRKWDKDGILFVSPSLILWQGGPILLSKPTFDNYALAVHYYGTNVTTDLAFGLFSATARKWNCPIFIGEFGSFAAYQSDIPLIGQKVEGHYTKWDDRFLSWAQWGFTLNWTPQSFDGWSGDDFSIVDERHNLRANFQIRPYAKRTAGLPLKMDVNDYEKAFSYTWNVTAHALVMNPTTVLFAPTINFFKVLNQQWLNVTLRGPPGGSLKCRYTFQELFMSCTAKSIGVHQVVISRMPGIPEGQSVPTA